MLITEKFHLFILFLFSWLFFSDIVFINEENTSCMEETFIDAINEAIIGAIITPENPLSCLFISCFTVSVAPSINKPDFLVILRFW